MEKGIKVGDRVRVSEDAPKIYTEGWSCDWLHAHSDVRKTEGDSAEIELDCYALVIPLKYLIKVEEEKEPKFKVGDKVIFIPTGKVKVVSRINANSLYTVTEPNGQSPLCVRETELAPYIEHNAPKFKVGDRVRNVKSDLCGIALNIEHGIVEVGIPYDKEKHYWNTDIVELFEPTEQTDAEEDARIRQKEAELEAFRKSELDRVLYPEKSLTYEVTVDNVAMDWQRYEADLAKEIALKVANKYNAPKEAAEYAVLVAKAVVEWLKKK